MRLQALLPVAAVISLPIPAAAAADFPHTVAPGESLASVAATDGLSVAQLAAANGLSRTSYLIAGRTLMIPPQREAGAADGTGSGAGNVATLIQLNIGSSSQANTAGGTPGDYSGGTGGDVSRGGNVRTLIQLNIGSSSQTNTAGPATIQASGANGAAASEGGARLLSPVGGARVSRPPLLRWTPVTAATYYNTQLYRTGTKILSAWPARAEFQLSDTWSYAGQLFRLTPGPYRWYVWPGFGSRAADRYGPMIGTATFSVTGPTDHRPEA